VPQKLLEAQTNTPTRTPTRTPVPFSTVPVISVTPSGTPPEGVLTCPDEPVYYGDVDLRYVRNCGHCMSEKPTPTRAAGGLPSVNMHRTALPRTPIFTPSYTPTGTLTIEPDDLTYYPTYTPSGYVIISTSAPTATPTDESPFTSERIHFPNAELHDNDATMWWLYPPVGYTGIYDYLSPVSSGTPFNIYNANSGDPSQLSFILSNFNGGDGVFVHHISFDYTSGTRSCSPDSTDCGNDLHVTGYDYDAGVSGYVGSPIYALQFSFGFPNSDATYDEGVTHHHEIDIDMTLMSMNIGVIQYGSPDGYDYVSDLYIEYAGAPPEPTPTAGSPTVTPTPTDIFGGDCRYPVEAADYSSSFSTGSVTDLGVSCFTLIPEIDLTQISEIYFRELQLCVHWFSIPTLVILGQTIPLGLFLVLPLGWVLRRLWQF